MLSAVCCCCEVVALAREVLGGNGVGDRLPIVCLTTNTPVVPLSAVFHCRRCEVVALAREVLGGTDDATLKFDTSSRFIASAVHLLAPLTPPFFHSSAGWPH
jgi:hypothetical protein